ncbi:MAG: glutamate synthase large subunit [Bacteroidetes bacterium]|nr:glutamate synthase large subunit [Bacteroidota bacterium]
MRADTLHVTEQEYHDACGVGFIADLNEEKSRRVIDYAITSLKRLSHRGSAGADNETGDGTGILVDIPKEFFKTVIAKEFRKTLSDGEGFGIAMVFALPKELTYITAQFAIISKEMGVNLLGVRDVPIDKSVLGEEGSRSCPRIVQFFISHTNEGDADKKLYMIRKKIERIIYERELSTHICSLSKHTIVYKGLLKKSQLHHFYKDLSHPEFKCSVALFHERYSTNTFSSWAMAQPFRMLGHNGEINTIKGNRLWMHTREDTIDTAIWGDETGYLKPLVSQSGSDSFSLDNALEFLTHSGKDIFTSVMMLIPEAYGEKADVSEELKNFYIYNENKIEPWDGPAALVFTDGKYVGAKLDRNGLRPLRYTITKDKLVVMGSEAGIIDVEPEQVLLHRHMKSGENFGIDLINKVILNDSDIIRMVTSKYSHKESLEQNLVMIKRNSQEDEFGVFGLPENGFDKRLRVLFGFDHEDMERFIIPMADSGKEPVGSMGDDTPTAALSKIPRRLYDYFKQMFAQVTNPPIDSIRERHVMSLFSYMGSEDNLLSDDSSFSGAIRIQSPVLSPRESIELLSQHQWFPHRTIKCHVQKDIDIAARLEEIKHESEEAVNYGAKIIFLSDEGCINDKLPIPMLLVVSTVHQYLIARKIRNKVSLLCFTGDVVEDHHVACLLGFGASAVYPYMAYEQIREYYAEGDWIDKMSNYRSSLEKGLLKIMARMGISCISSYQGSMLFHCIGLSDKLVNDYFPSVKTYLPSVGLDKLKEYIQKRSDRAFVPDEIELKNYGRYKYKSDGEAHGWSPDKFKNIQAISKGKAKLTESYEKVVFVRDLFEFRKAKVVSKATEDENQIVKRFGLGAISFGAISEQSHRTLAKGAALVGARSNTGEGGEQPDRFDYNNPDDSYNCYIKQVASGRFGVTPYYLSAAREIQIKMAQGAKPGEGGQLPGFKVTIDIANARHTTPGVPLISPPPHHDIYSIEDIAQLIFDLKMLNPRVKISIKLVSQPGVGIVASGLAKGGADIILISGNDGGTGATPLGSMKHTGLPWEFGLFEVHKSLVASGLRDRVTLRVDGGLKNAKDIVVASILGAEEYDFGTAALISIGCVMARKCHSNNCPVGIATQDPNFKKKFKGEPENVAYFLKNMAKDVKELIEELGVKSINDLIGRTDLLKINGIHESYIADRSIDLRYFRENKRFRYDPAKYIGTKDLPKSVDDLILEEIKPAITTHGFIAVERKLKNTDRAVGTKISGHIAFLYGKDGFKGNIQIRSDGVAGQSLGAFLVSHIEIRHCGAANDYVGKGMSGGLISIRYPKTIRETGISHTILGNVALFGATGGKLFVAGTAGERFAVRNSGAAAVVESVGNNACEYMTRGVVVALTKIGFNFGAGMTGGVAYIYKTSQELEKCMNEDSVSLAGLNSNDEFLLEKMIRNFAFHTGSKRAEEILLNWHINKGNFVKVIPTTIENIDVEEIYQRQLKKIGRKGFVKNGEELIPN